MQARNLIVAAGVCLAASLANAQTLSMKCIGRVDLFDLAVAQIGGLPNPNRIGTNPATCAIVGDDLYVAGFNNNLTTIPGRVVKVANALAAPSFQTIPAAEKTMPAFYGFTGMEYQPGGGLLITFDDYSYGPAGQIRLLDIDSGPSPTLLAESPVNSVQGICGPAWDNGYDGTGWDYTVGGQPRRGPIPTVLFPGFVGPFGLNPTTLDAGLGQTVFEYNPPTNNLRLDFVGVTGTTWRDHDINPVNGTYAARVNNDLVIGKRAGDNVNFTTQTFIDFGDAPFQAGQNVQIMHNYPGGSKVIMNDRRVGGGGQPFASVVKVFDEDGNAVAMNFLNTDTPLPGFLVDGNAWYDFSWDPATKRLAVLDFVDLYAYVFIPCPADIDGNGEVDLADFFAFFDGYDNALDSANVDGNPGVDLGDFFTFFSFFDVGCI